MISRLRHAILYLYLHLAVCHGDCAVLGCRLSCWTGRILWVAKWWKAMCWISLYQFHRGLPLTYQVWLDNWGTRHDGESGKALDCDLHVVACQNWIRKMLFPQTGLLWMMPSLGIPRFETALLYPACVWLREPTFPKAAGPLALSRWLGHPLLIPNPKRCHELKTVGRSTIHTSVFQADCFKTCRNPMRWGTCACDRPLGLSPVQTGIVLLGTIRTLYSKNSNSSQLRNLADGRSSNISLGDLLTSAIMDTQSIIAQCERESLGFAQHKIQYHL